MIAFVHENHRIRDKYVQKKQKKKQIHTFRINQITFTYGEGKKERPNFTKCSVKICRFLPLLPTLKMKPLQCNAIGVCTPSARRNIDRPVMSQNEVTKTSGGVWF